MSEELETLLRSGLPEVRKVHAMNEWVHAALGSPDNFTAADEKLTEALKLTEPWGKQAGDGVVSEPAKREAAGDVR